MNIASREQPITEDTSKRLLILSDAYRDELTEVASSLGWHVVSARRDDELAGRFMGSESSIALIDMRDSFESGIECVCELTSCVEANGLALVTLGGARNKDSSKRLMDAGATHILSEQFETFELDQILRLASRFVDRVRGNGEQVSGRSGELQKKRLGWNIKQSRRLKVNYSQSLQSDISARVKAFYPNSALYRSLSFEERSAARAAFKRFAEGQNQVAFAHNYGDQKVVHHIRRNEGEVSGYLERLSDGSSINDWTDRDFVTGQKNGKAAREWLAQALGEPHSVVNVVLLGLRRFDSVNAAYGRSVGDALLARVGRRIHKMVAEETQGTGLVARLAGQEFLVACKGVIDAERLQFIAGQMIDAISRPFVAGDHIIRLGSRVGMATNLENEDGASLLRRASLALAEIMAMSSGGSKIRDASIEQSIELNGNLENDLRYALDRDEIKVVFQPQFDVQSGKLTGAEALARWEHPKYGNLGAASLFAAAERSDYIEPLSEHIQSLALRSAAAWPNSLSELRLSLNITAHDLGDSQFLSNFLERVSGSGFPLDRLTLEITESSLIRDLDHAAVLLHAVQDAGMRVAADDFGTGYSSLAYLKSLPLDYLKMDSGLTQDISASERDQIVVRSVIDMAKSLDISVIAEGVETETQLALLADQGCQYFQGFLRSGALTSEEFENFALSND